MVPVIIRRLKRNQRRPPQAALMADIQNSNFSSIASPYIRDYFFEPKSSSAKESFIGPFADFFEPKSSSRKWGVRVSSQLRSTVRPVYSRFNTDAQQFNKKINSAAAQLQKQYPDLKLVIFDVFKPLYDIVSDPKKYGFTDATRGFCGTGTAETTSLLCNPKLIGTCTNSSQYVFWDSVHPSQAANQILSDSLIVQGIALIS